MPKLYDVNVTSLPQFCRHYDKSLIYTAKASLEAGIHCRVTSPGSSSLLSAVSVTISSAGEPIPLSESLSVWATAGITSAWVQ